MKLRIILCLFLLLFLFPRADANVWDDFASPLKYEESQKVIIFGASATLLVSFFKDTFVKSTQREVQKDLTLCCRITDAGNNYLQIFPNAIYALGFGLNYYFNHDQNSERRAIGMVKATLYSGLITNILKPIVAEKRPNGGKHSFPSGHTTTAFAFASFVANEHPWYIGIPAYTMATFVGYARIHDNYHYIHDVMAGATIGMSYGIAQSLKSSQEISKDSVFFLSPTEDMKGGAVRYAIQF